MDVAGKLRELESKRVLLTAAGGLGTFGYLCLLGLLTKWSKLLEMEPNNVGDFLAGAFAPLAFLWLVIGYFLQAIELKQNSESLMQQAAEMKNAVEQATEQAQALKASEFHARHSSLTQMRELYTTELAMASIEVYAYTAHPVSGYENVEELLPQLSAGDKWIFADRLIIFLCDKNNRENLVSEYKGDPGFRDAISAYMHLYRDFCGSMTSIGASKDIWAFYDLNPLGQLYKTLHGLVGDQLKPVEDLV